MLNTLTENIAAVLHSALGDAVDDLQFGQLVDDVLDDLADRLAALDAEPAA